MGRSAEPYRRRSQGNPLTMIVMTVLAVGAAFYLVTALSAGDLLWAISRPFETRAARITILHEGERRVFRPGEPTFEALTDALNPQLGQIVGYQETGIRPEVVEELYTRHTLALFEYASPIDIRTRWNLGEPRQILVPVDGPLSRGNRVYTGDNDIYGHGALILENLAPLYALVRETVASDDDQ